jgi:hypothetical protein
VSYNFDEEFVRPDDGLPRDLLLVLDSSGSISDEEFAAMIQGLKILIDRLSINITCVCVCVRKCCVCVFVREYMCVCVFYSF